MRIGDNNAIVVAHPDDEVLWAASLPIRFHEKHWTVICCSVPKRDPIRAQKFVFACDRLGAESMVLLTREPSATEPLRVNLPDLSGYDTVFTHNAWGEYGHLHHMNIHDQVVRACNGTTQLYTFGYRKGGLGVHEIELTNKELMRKLHALAAYDHVLPYEGRPIPKSEAISHRYFTVEGIDPDLETFD